MTNLRYAPTIVLATPAPISHRTAEENLGIGILASLLRNSGYRIRVVDGWLEGLTTTELAHRIALAPNLLWVGFSCYRTNMEPAKATVETLRRGGCEVPMVAGGFGPSFEPEVFLRAGFDVVALGESECTVLPLTEHYRIGTPKLDEVPGIAFLQNGKLLRTDPLPLNDLNESPRPARDTLSLALARKSAPHIESARGCLAGCTFCSIVAFVRVSHGARWRQKSLDRFVAELEELHGAGIRVVKIIDDSFIEPPRDAIWAARLADELQQRGINLLMRASLRADRITDELLFHLRRAGFFSCSCGIENFSATALRRMAKMATPRENYQALDLFAKHGFYVQAGHILFDHATTADELIENLVAMRRFDWTISKGIFTEMFAAAGTAYTRLLTRAGLARDTEEASMNRHYEIADPISAKVHRGLKRWQKSHSSVYDKAIDVLSAPKAVDPEMYERFHEVSRALRKVDLDTFEQLIDRAIHQATDSEIDLWLECRITETADFFADVRIQTDRLYQLSGLRYDGQENPFI